MSIWHYIDTERQPKRPLSTDELRQARSLGVLDLKTLVWCDGMLHWRALGELAAQLTPEPEAGTQDVAMTAYSGMTVQPPPPPPQPTPVAGARAVFGLGSDLTGDATGTSILAPTAPVALHTPQLSDAAAAANPYRSSRTSTRRTQTRFDDSGVVYAGFWKRAAALIVDGMVIGILGGLGGEALGSLLGDLAGGSDLAVAFLMLLSTLALYLCYFGFFHSAINGATPGTLLIGIKVVRPNGEPISFLHAVGRYLATVPSSLILGSGYLMAASPNASAPCTI